ncbi:MULTISPECIES: porin [Pandoraea]|uniref:porin n=1 Tax=Pandoraea TaxID=93217 RepID=UPI001F5C28F0|nr:MULTISPECIES: porin [Pandoraea]MCI3208297.1 porin [Pandoraea sp. LA3]MDN4586326.1 porin [Pandoraea capi]
MKSDWALALLCATLATTSLTSHAQSSVTLYGIIDEGITYTNNQNGGAAWQVQSGEASASRFGFRGTEDLGGGYRSVFVLENGFDPSSGTLANNGRLFGRQAFVGVSSPYGTVTLGRQYDEIVDMLARVDASLQWGIYFAHAGDVDNTSGSVRINNSVKYTSPTVHGVTFAGLYGFGGQPGSVSTQSTSSVGASYSEGPIYLAAAYLYMKNPLQAGFDNLAPKNVIYSAYVPSATSWRVIGAGGSYKLGDVTLGAEYTTTRFANGFNNADVSFDNYEVNVGWVPRPDLSLGAAFVYTHGKLDATGAIPNYRAIDLNADYLLSKRTDVYLSCAYLKAGGAAPVAAITYIPAPSSTPTQLAVRVGVRHRF